VRRKDPCGAKTRATKVLAQSESNSLETCEREQPIRASRPNLHRARLRLGHPSRCQASWWRDISGWDICATARTTTRLKRSAAKEVFCAGGHLATFLRGQFAGDLQLAPTDSSFDQQLLVVPVNCYGQAEETESALPMPRRFPGKRSLAFCRSLAGAKPKDGNAAGVTSSAAPAVSVRGRRSRLGDGSGAE
jgi:hypothetical protein